MNEYRVECDICKGGFRPIPSHINLICKECQDKEKQELIEVFLRDWRWGNAFDNHFFRFEDVPHLMLGCKCAFPAEYWIWFEEKWEKRQVK